MCRVAHLKCPIVLSHVNIPNMARFRKCPPTSNGILVGAQSIAATFGVDRSSHRNPITPSEGYILPYFLLTLIKQLRNRSKASALADETGQQHARQAGTADGAARSQISAVIPRRRSIDHGYSTMVHPTPGRGRAVDNGTAQ